MIAERGSIGAPTITLKIIAAGDTMTTTMATILAKVLKFRHAVALLKKSCGLTKSHAAFTNVSITFFSPAFSNATVSLLPSTARMRP